MVSTNGQPQSLTEGLLSMQYMVDMRASPLFFLLEGSSDPAVGAPYPKQKKVTEFY